ncbi:hypothetical protein BST13_30495 [Mycobacterium aquaticum]|uniref:Uncharacterized protein n=1 Tax=Mycobacterium aquaticum TaxID=1927124 RepID=A0A1X0ABG7_9MYCO|nr:hypothetical protein BST13_30495 [Mycobacterium aquaticum]
MTHTGFSIVPFAGAAAALVGAGALELAAWFGHGFGSAGAVPEHADSTTAAAAVALISAYRLVLMRSIFAR